MKSLLRILLPIIALSAPLAAEADAIIAKARSYLGSEQALQAVRSVHYKGTLTSTVAPADVEPRVDVASIEIIFAKPYFQKIIINQAGDAANEVPGKIEVTALDDYEAWQRIENPLDASQWRMTLLDTAQIRRLRANTAENLAFFSGRGSTVTDMGVVSTDDGKLHKVVYDHGYGISFTRFFDPQTGRLVISQTDNGAIIREEGENRISGVRFPGEVTTISQRPDGGTTTVNVVFDSVTVNETFPPTAFRVPSVTNP
ncbi:hypothetical protein [Synoicihabitans lomoniglobus]|uniref:Outer membrane lipoprotein-sorting protein n=1 Tax=Synoicihabitans lomoniglobus TaxID=2909285 RepID=A0AAF0CPN3_9BACT|nr:hypothetical protein [Opitutaceae bacterium LMO-M01]WED65644.1 hypothetical protein PXH66_02125 [Opitutaceae bacterium LMO-M01]